MNNDSLFLHEWVDRLLLHYGCSEAVADAINRWVCLVIIILFALFVDFVTHRGVIRLVRKIVTHTKYDWDDMLFNQNVVRRLCKIVTPITIYLLLPIGFGTWEGDHDWIYELITRGVEIYIVVTCMRLFNALLKAGFDIAEHRPAWHGKPIKGLMQTGQVALVCVAAILVLAILIDKSPIMLLTGLGASAAVLMLIFKDSILGLVAGVQLSANNMLKVGDWITMSHHGVDGVVEEVALTTIKVRGWDNTLQTLPPYLLISEPFGNWQAMRDSGGRRIKRSINIDMTSVTFAHKEFIERLSHREATAPLMLAIDATNIEGSTLTNLDLYMRSMNHYLNNHPRVNHNMLVLVRQLQPNQWGLPVEFYCFSADVNWVPYEQLQAEVISYFVAMAPLYGLRIHQAPTDLGARTSEAEL